MIYRTYTALSRIPTFEGRYRYLKLAGVVGESTFGFDRYLNQALYTSQKWKSLRNKIIIRDNGCDLAHPDYEIGDRIYIHHLNPITLEQIESRSEVIFEPEFLVCTSFQTHQAIHYGDEKLLPRLPVERRPNDTCPWK